jgi:hypothetical protein
VRELRVGDARVSVMTVLPEDTAQRIPRPSRDIASLPVSYWATWMLIGVGVFILAMLGVWWRRRGMRGPPPVAPVAAAKKAFGRLEALDLVSAGEPAKHVAASADILRAYLAARDAAAAQGLTTSELVDALRGDGAVPLERIEAVLATADAIKFSGQTIDGAGAERIAGEAASIVNDVHRADLHQTRRKTRR